MPSNCFIPQTNKKILLLDNGSDGINDLVRILNRENVSLQVLPFSSLSRFNHNEFDLIVLTGESSASVDNHLADYSSQVALIKTSNVPIIGICLGFELITRAYNFRMVKLPERVKGVRLVSLSNTINLPIEKRFIVGFQSHVWSARPSTTAFEILGSSEYGAEIIKHKTRHLYGFQFHPEVRASRCDNSELIDVVLQMIWVI